MDETRPNLYGIIQVLILQLSVPDLENSFLKAALPGHKLKATGNEIFQHIYFK